MKRLTLITTFLLIICTSTKEKTQFTDINKRIKTNEKEEKKSNPKKNLYSDCLLSQSSYNLQNYFQSLMNK